MKRFFLVLLCLLSSAAYPAESIEIAASESLKPYEELLTRVFKRADFDLKFVLLPQARLIKELEAGRHDGGFLLSDFAINDIPGMVRIPVPLYQGQQVAVSTRTDIRINSPGDLSNYSVGIERGNKSQEVLLPQLRNVYASSNSQSLFAMLAAGRLDIVIAPAARVAAYAQEAKIQHYLVHQPAVVTFPLYLTLSKHAAMLEPRLTPVFRAAVASGEWPREVAAIHARIAPPGSTSAAEKSPDLIRR